MSIASTIKPGDIIIRLEYNKGGFTETELTVSSVDKNGTIRCGRTVVDKAILANSSAKQTRLDAYHSTYPLYAYATADTIEKARQSLKDLAVELTEPFMKQAKNRLTRAESEVGRALQRVRWFQNRIAFISEYNGPNSASNQTNE